MKFFISTLMLLSIVSCGDKIAFVNNQKVLEEYAPYKKINDEVRVYGEKKDSVVAAFRAETAKYDEKSKTLPKAEKDRQYQSLVQRSQQLQQQINISDQQMQQKTQSGMDSVNAKIKTFIENYGKTHSYSFILGQTSNNNIYFADEAKDITENIVKELNGNLLEEKLEEKK